jgi:WD40 repeat protein
MSSEPSNLQIKVLATLEGHSGWVTSVKFDPTGRFLATGGDDMTAKVWRLSPESSAATCVATLMGHSRPVSAVAFDPTGRFIATCSHDKTATLWEIKQLGLTHGGRMSRRKNKRSNRKYKKGAMRRSRMLDRIGNS